MADLPTAVMFRCCVCAEVAATVGFVGNSRDPQILRVVQREERIVPPSMVEGWMTSGLSAGEASLQIVGFLGDVYVRLDAQRTRRVAVALDQADAQALYGVDRGYAPFYCAVCNAVYCRRHWDTTVVFDEDDPSWYDCTHGVCPSGHRRVVDD